MKHHWIVSHSHGEVVCRDCWYFKRLLDNVPCDRTQFISSTHKWEWIPTRGPYLNEETDTIYATEAGGYWQCIDCLRIVLGSPSPAPAQTCGGILMDQVLT